MIRDAAFTDALGTRRLRAAADMAYASAAYGDVLSPAQAVPTGCLPGPPKCPGLRGLHRPADPSTHLVDVHHR